MKSSPRHALETRPVGAARSAFALLLLALLLGGCGTFGVDIPDPTAATLRTSPGEGFGYTEIYVLPSNAVIQIDNTRYLTHRSTAGAWLKGYLPVGDHTVAVSAPGHVTRYRDIDVSETEWSGGMVYLCEQGVNNRICRD